MCQNISNDISKTGTNISKIDAEVSQADPDIGNDISKTDADNCKIDAAIIEADLLKAELRLVVIERDLEVDSLSKGLIQIFERRYVSFLYFGVDVLLIVK